MRRHQSCHNYNLPSPAQETERPRPQFSPACFTHKCQQIYRELFALPPSLGKIWAERQSLIKCVGIKVVSTTISPLPTRKQKGYTHHSNPHASLTSDHKCIESFLCVGIKVVTTTICPLTRRKQKGHAHHSHPHASLTSANKSIEIFLHYHPRWERYGRRGKPKFYA